MGSTLVDAALGLHTVGSINYTLAENQISLSATGSVGVASKQGQQFATRLNQNLLYFVRVDDFDFHHSVGQCFPQIGNGHIIAHLELLNVTKVAGTGITAMASDDAVCVGASDGKARLAQVSRTFRHMGIGSSEKNRHFQFHGGYRDHAKGFIFQTIASQKKTGLLIVIFAAETRLSLGINALIIGAHIYPEVGVQSFKI